MLFPAVNGLAETLGDLLRFTCLAIEIHNLQMDILREQRFLELDDSFIDSVQVLEHPFRSYVQQAARNMCNISGHYPSLYPFVRYPPITNQEKNLRIAMGMVLCRRKSKLDLLDIPMYKSLNFLTARAKEISGLCRDLRFLQSLFKDFESICNVPVKRQHLEGSLLELACRTEDVIEGYVFDHSINSKTFNFISNLVNEPPSSIMGEVPFLKEIFSMFDKKNGIQQQVLQTLRKIDLIKREVKKIYDKAPIVTETLQLGKNNVIVDSLAATKKHEVFDIDNDGFVTVLDRVIRIPSAVEVVPIVGMGGIGKTTLAQRVFYHPLTCYHFYIRAWVVVSQVHQVRDILIGLLRCIKEITDEIYEKTNGQLAEELYRSLKGQRFLIVLDNIWSTKAWDDVKRCFPDDKNSSRIVLTTRLMKVADYVNNKQPPHYVNLLDADQSWKLLQQMVFGEEEPCPLEFEDVGKRIATKCQGLPLAIVVVAGILRKITRTRDCWEGIAKSVSSAVSSDPEQCLEVLALSYNHLPDHLKTCLLYMGAFPEDGGIEVPKLINLWIAEGFLDNTLTLTLEDKKLSLMAGSIRVRSKLRSNFPKSTMELEAKGYLEDLIGRNLVLVGKRSFNGELRMCRLHDLVQDLCLREAQKAKFMLVVKRDSISVPSSMINQRRLCFHSNILDNFHSVPPMSLVRSFLYFDVGFGNDMPDTLFFKASFKLLRVLDIVFLRFQYFPLEILKLVQLRYLAFTATFELPISISKLMNLQTLIIYGPWIHQDHDQSSALLLEYWKMPWLRHLHTSVACYLSNPFIAIKDLCFSVHECKLQSLSAVTFSSCSEEVFSLMCSLKKLGVVESGEDYRTDDSSKWLSNLVHLKFLEELKCSFYVQNGSPRSRLSWILPSSLKKLTLSWSYIPWGNMAPIAMLPNLEVLKLKNYAFQGPEWEPPDEGFRCLKHLLIENHDLVHLEATRIHFPRLEHIALRSCRSLEEISFGIAEIPTLQLIELHYCSESAENSAKEIQEQIDGLNVDIRRST